MVGIGWVWNLLESWVHTLECVKDKIGWCYTDEMSVIKGNIWGSPFMIRYFGFGLYLGTMVLFFLQIRVSDLSEDWMARLGIFLEICFLCNLCNLSFVLWTESREYPNPLLKHSMLPLSQRIS